MNNYDILIVELREKYLEKELIDYSIISEVEKENMKKINIVFSIKSKLFDKNYKTFKNILERF